MPGSVSCKFVVAPGLLRTDDIVFQEIVAILRANDKSAQWSCSTRPIVSLLSGELVSGSHYFWGGTLKGSSGERFRWDFPVDNPRHLRKSTLETRKTSGDYETSEELYDEDSEDGEEAANEESASISPPVVTAGSGRKRVRNADANKRKEKRPTYEERQLHILQNKSEDAEDKIHSQNVDPRCREAGKNMNGPSVRTTFTSSSQCSLQQTSCQTGESQHFVYSHQRQPSQAARQTTANFTCLSLSHKHLAGKRINRKFCVTMLPSPVPENESNNKCTFYDIHDKSGQVTLNSGPRPDTKVISRASPTAPRIRTVHAGGYPLSTSTPSRDVLRTADWQHSETSQLLDPSTIDEVDRSPCPNIELPFCQYDLQKRRGLEFSGAGMKGWGKREIPEKTRRPTASSGTIPTCENPVTRPRIEPVSPWWEVERANRSATAAPMYRETVSLQGRITPPGLAEMLTMSGRVAVTVSVRNMHAGLDSDIFQSAHFTANRLHTRGCDVTWSWRAGRGPVQARMRESKGPFCNIRQMFHVIKIRRLRVPNPYRTSRSSVPCIIRAQFYLSWNRERFCRYGRSCEGHRANYSDAVIKVNFSRASEKCEITVNGIHTLLYTRSIRGELAFRNKCPQHFVRRTDVYVRCSKRPTLFASRQGEPGSIPGRVTPGFSHTGFPGDLPFPLPFQSGAAPYSPQSPSSALETSLLRAAQIFPLTRSHTYASHPKVSEQSHFTEKQESNAYLLAAPRACHTEGFRRRCGGGDVKASQQSGVAQPHTCRHARQPSDEALPRPSFGYVRRPSEPPYPVEVNFPSVKEIKKERKRATSLASRQFSVVFSLDKTTPYHYGLLTIFSASLTNREWTIGTKLLFTSCAKNIDEPTEKAHDVNQANKLFSCTITLISGSKESMRIKRVEYERAPECEVGEIKEMPEKIRRPVSSSDTIPMYGNWRSAPVENRTRCALMRVFSGISHFSHPCIPELLHIHLDSPSSALKTSFLRGMVHENSGVLWRWLMCRASGRGRRIALRRSQYDRSGIDYPPCVSTRHSRGINVVPPPPPATPHKRDGSRVCTCKAGLRGTAADPFSDERCLESGEKERPGTCAMIACYCPPPAVRRSDIPSRACAVMEHRTAHLLLGVPPPPSRLHTIKGSVARGQCLLSSGHWNEKAAEDGNYGCRLPRSQSASGIMNKAKAVAFPKVDFKSAHSIVNSLYVCVSEAKFDEALRKWRPAYVKHAVSPFTRKAPNWNAIFPSSTHLNADTEAANSKRAEAGVIRKFSDLQTRFRSLTYKYADINCTSVVCCHRGKLHLDTILQERTDAERDVFACRFCNVDLDDAVDGWHWIKHLTMKWTPGVDCPSRVIGYVLVTPSSVSEEPSKEVRESASMPRRLQRATYRHVKEFEQGGMMVFRDMGLSYRDISARTHDMLLRELDCTILYDSDPQLSVSLAVAPASSNSDQVARDSELITSLVGECWVHVQKTNNRSTSSVVYACNTTVIFWPITVAKDDRLDGAPQWRSDSRLRLPQDEPGSIRVVEKWGGGGGSLPDFRTWESRRTMPLVCEFSLGYPVYSALAFRRCSI
ncbi:hypothetical protein PR048_023952 [Dryococelus australis]|uniref:Uncharacterized protein n=1 Tax=Dryococelus australis TaxID=614101 RepID=A0ABQ9GVK8_9NEOP|nr:hypothetical protein PR048_023952 [Dryococelus australis]